MDFHQQRQRELNRLFSVHASTLGQLQEALQNEANTLVIEYALSHAQAAALHDYANDQLTLFRSLRKNEYSIPRTLSQLKDTLHWRLQQDWSTLSVTSFQDNFLSLPFCFFHKEDRYGRPVYVIQLKHMLPDMLRITKDNTSLLDFTLFCLEHARRLTLIRTRERQKTGVPDPLILELTVLVDFRDAGSLPVDTRLLQALHAVLKRYPGLSGVICLVNFGWMYQGVWQMCKLLLSREARNRISFPNPGDLLTIVAKEDLLADLGGEDTYEWVLSSDPVYAQQIFPRGALTRAPSSSLSIYHDADRGTTSASSAASTRRSSMSMYCTPTGAETPSMTCSSLGIPFLALAQRLSALIPLRSAEATRDRLVIRTGRYPARRRKRQFVQSFVFQMWHILIHHRSAFCCLLILILFRNGFATLPGRFNQWNRMSVSTRLANMVRRIT